MHDEYKDLLFIIVTLLVFATATTVIIGYNMKPNMMNVSTFITERLKYKRF